MIRPTASNVSALSRVVAKGHQAIHFVSSTPSYHAVGRVFPVRLEASLVAPRPSAAGPGGV